MEVCLVKTSVCQLFEFAKKRFTDFSLQYKGALTTNSGFFNSVHRLSVCFFVCFFRGKMRGLEDILSSRHFFLDSKLSLLPKTMKFP